MTAIPAYREDRWLRRLHRPARGSLRRLLDNARLLAVDLLALFLRVVLAMALLKSWVGWANGHGLTALPAFWFDLPGLPDLPALPLALLPVLGLLLPLALLLGCGARCGAALVALWMLAQHPPLLGWGLLGAAMLALHGPGRLSLEGLWERKLYGGLR